MATSLFGVGEILNAANSGTIVPQSFTGTAGQTVFNITNFTYTPDTSSIEVFINGTRQVSGRDFTETSPSSITLIEGVLLGDFVDVEGVVAFTPLAVVPGSINFGGGYTLQQSILDNAVNVKSFPYLAKGNGIADDTLAIQAAVNAAGFGAQIYFPRGTYEVNGTITFLSGQTAIGTGWSTVTNTFTLKGGAVIVQNSTLDIPTFLFAGPDNNTHVENTGTQGIAFYNNNQNATVGIAIQYDYARKPNILNVYIAGWNKGIHFKNQVWGYNISHSLITNCTIPVQTDSASEDSVIYNCDLSPFRTGSSACFQMVNQVQNMTLINVGLHFSDYAVIMQQGDTNGDGTGISLPMHLCMIGCYIEDVTFAGVLSISSNGNDAAKNHPSINIQSCRFFNGGAFSTPNTGQAIVCALHASQITVNDIRESGFSYGAILGQSAFGFTFAGNEPASIVWGLDTAYTYGTTRFLGSTKQVTFIRGDSPNCVLTSGAGNTTIALTGGFGNPVWDTVTNDFWSWGNTTLSRIIPTRIGTYRISCTIYLTATVAAHRYALSLSKNGTGIASLSDLTTPATTNPLMLHGSWIDKNTAITDFYKIQLFTDTGGATVAINPAFCQFSVEMVGA